MVIAFVNCQKEDDTLQLEPEVKNQTSTTKIVSAGDIPEVMDFISSKSPEFKFLLDDSTTDEGINRSHEDNLVMTKLLTYEITQVTNAYEKSNYTFSLTEETTKQGTYFLNLVVKEYKDTFYLYIVKYVPDTNWLSNHSIIKDFGDFTGMTYFYNDEGIYVAKVTMVSGNSIASERHPCDDPEDDGNSGDDGTGGGGDNDCQISMVWYECEGTDSNIPHSPEECNAYTGEQTGSGWNIVESCAGTKSMSSFLRHPCEGSGGATGGGNTDCTPDPNCIFPMQLNENCVCDDPQAIENGDVGILIDKDALTTVTDCLGQDNEHIPFIVYNQLETTIANYINLNVCSPETEQFLEEAIEEFENILDELPDAKIERYFELKALIIDDPWALIQDCAQQNGMDTANYIDLYNHTIPQECQNRLDNLGFGYSNQPINDGNVPCVNMDYYSVEISNYTSSEADIYQAFREKFTDLASGEKDDFQFSCNIPNNSTNTGDINWEFVPLTVNDGNLFTSNNPLTAILLINAGVDIGGVIGESATSDEGAIIVSEFTPNDWTISTIGSPQNGTQPFSGNRQWGWFINQNGNLEFFTRAVDVANINKILNILPGTNTECQQDTYYNIADATWENLQQEIKEWIENEGIGQATINTPKTLRIKRETIEEILKSNDSISQILSNCD